MSKTWPTAKLNTGATIPLLGFGTYAAVGKETTDATVASIKEGFTHIDTAAIYKCEDAVGTGIKESGIEREKLFVVSKLWLDRKGDVRAALDETLEKLQLDYLDSYLIHWPQTWDSKGNPTPYGTQPDFHAAWKEMSAIFKEGKKLKSIGVSNFSIKTLEELASKAGDDYVVPAINQVELSPDLPQNELLAYCREKGIHVTAWSPLGGGTSNPATNGGSVLLTHPKVIAIAEAHKVSTGQVLISWGIQRGTSVIPKSSSPARIAQNAKIITLTPEEMQVLNSKHADAENPQRIAKGESKTKMALGWTYEEMGWEERERM
ncbi:Aldo/keto reductase [Mrakia frigida]|uniref:aldo/keto reductase family protein n=1 Tax=Mrakia frigida TaxID=29902 RepID=UPI003FCBF07B